MLVRHQQQHAHSTERRTPRWANNVVHARLLNQRPKRFYACKPSLPTRYQEVPYLNRGRIISELVAELASRVVNGRSESVLPANLQRRNCLFCEQARETSGANFNRLDKQSSCHEPVEIGMIDWSKMRLWYNRNLAMMRQRLKEFRACASTLVCTPITRHSAGRICLK